MPIDQIEAHTPGFTDEFERNLTMAGLMDQFHGEAERARDDHPE